MPSRVDRRNIDGKPRRKFKCPFCAASLLKYYGKSVEDDVCPECDTILGLDPPPEIKSKQKRRTPQII